MKNPYVVYYPLFFVLVNVFICILREAAKLAKKLF